MNRLHRASAKQGKGKERKGKRKNIPSRGGPLALRRWETRAASRRPPILQTHGSELVCVGVGGQGRRKGKKK